MLVISVCLALHVHSQAEDVVPAPTVEARRVVAELVEDLIHLEGRWQGLNEHGTADDALRQAESGRCQREDVIPQPEPVSSVLESQS